MRRTPFALVRLRRIHYTRAMIGPALRSPEMDALLSAAADSLLRYSGHGGAPSTSAAATRLSWYIPYPLRAASAGKSRIFGDSSFAAALALDDLLQDLLLECAIPHCIACKEPGARRTLKDVLSGDMANQGTILVSAPFPKSGPSLQDYLEILQSERALIDGQLIHRDELQPTTLKTTVGTMHGGVVLLSTAAAEQALAHREIDQLMANGLTVLDLHLIDSKRRNLRHLGRISGGLLCPSCNAELPAVSADQLSLKSDARPISLWGVPLADALHRPIRWWFSSLPGGHTAARVRAELKRAIEAGFGDIALSWDTRVACFEEGFRLSLLRLLQNALSDCTFLVDDLRALPDADRLQATALLTTLSAAGNSITFLQTSDDDQGIRETPSVKPAPANHAINIPYPSGPTYDAGAVSIPSPGITLLTGPSRSGKTSLLCTGCLAFAGSPPGRAAFASHRLVLFPDQAPARSSTLASEADLLTPLTELFADLPASRVRGLTPGAFSLVSGPHRCDSCAGSGYAIPSTPIPVPPTPCTRCCGERFTGPTTRIRLGPISYAQLLALPLDAALSHLRAHPKLAAPILALIQGGFGELPLGYPAYSLTRAELHRVRCLSALAVGTNSPPKLILLDMPLLGASRPQRAGITALMRRAAEAGNTVVLADSCPDPSLSVDAVFEFTPAAGAHARFALRATT